VPSSAIAGGEREAGHRALAETSVLVTRSLEASLPYRRSSRSRVSRRYRERLPTPWRGCQCACTGVSYWGDQRSNTLFRRDAGALQAWLVDAETRTARDLPDIALRTRSPWMRTRVLADAAAVTEHLPPAATDGRGDRGRYERSGVDHARGGHPGQRELPHPRAIRAPNEPVHRGDFPVETGEATGCACARW
jgi:hypothetical protein